MKKWLKKISLVFLLLLLMISHVFPKQAEASEASRYGIHILAPQEIDDARQLLKNQEQNDWNYLTIPFPYTSLEKPQDWEEFMKKAKEYKFIPLVRLATTMTDQGWAIPSKREIVEMIDFLSDLEWPTGQKHIIVFNEVNHAKEWGGKIDPKAYAEALRFTSCVAHSRKEDFVVMNAAMDLAAPNGQETMEAFTYLDKMLAENPAIFNYIDAWNSHSYPNPAFSAPPYNDGKNSLKGFEHELKYISGITSKKLDVYITETGWVETKKTSKWLENYYTYAVDHIWSHEKVRAVTPFLLRGAPGPFTYFSFLSDTGEPTLNYRSYQQAVFKLF